MFKKIYFSYYYIFLITINYQKINKFITIEISNEKIS